jgi:uncharacterized protein with von Willebrand factor type A (vWA) domain
MRPEDTLAMMELDTPDAPAADVVGAEVGAVAAKAKPQDTVLKLDKWSLRKGVELLTDELTHGATGMKDKLADENPDGTRHLTPEQEYWGKALADFHAAIYEPNPEMNEACTDELRNQFLKQVVDTPEFQEMRNNTVLNPAAAELATGCFTKQFAARRAEALRDQAQGGKGPKGGGGGKTPGMGGADGEIQTMKAAAQAVAAAAKAVEELNDAAEMCGIGGDGPTSGKLDAKRVAGVFNRVKKSPNLQRIAKLAGRFRRLAQSKQRQKVTHGADEVIGVTMGDEIAKLVPAEMVKLVDPTMMLDTARRLFDRQCLVRETRAREPVGKGPIVVTVDESGSMHGAKVETAKALALALAWIARKQKRWCVLVSFSGGSKIEPGSQCILPPGRTDETALLTWLEHFYSGGTTMDVPLHELPAWWPEYVKAGMQRGKTDIVMITDAEVDVPAALEKSFKEFKAREKVKLTTLVVQGSPGNIQCVADEVHEVGAISTESDAVGKILSV